MTCTSSARRCFHVLTLGLAMSCFTMIAAPANTTLPAIPTASATTVLAATPLGQQELQFADEITRRLRRLGLNFNRARIQRPYDPAGELC